MLQLKPRHQTFYTTKPTPIVNLTLQNSPPNHTCILIKLWRWSWTNLNPLCRSQISNSPIRESTAILRPAPNLSLMISLYPSSPANAAFLWAPMALVFFSIPIYVLGLIMIFCNLLIMLRFLQKDWFLILYCVVGIQGKQLSWKSSEGSTWWTKKWLGFWEDRRFTTPLWLPPVISLILAARSVSFTFRVFTSPFSCLSVLLCTGWIVIWYMMEISSCICLLDKYVMRWILIDFGNVLEFAIWEQVYEA